MTVDRVPPVDDARGSPVTPCLLLLLKPRSICPIFCPVGASPPFILVAAANGVRALAASSPLPENTIQVAVHLLRSRRGRRPAFARFSTSMSPARSFHVAQCSI